MQIPRRLRETKDPWVELAAHLEGNLTRDYLQEIDQIPGVKGDLTSPTIHFNFEVRGVMPELGRAGGDDELPHLLLCCAGLKLEPDRMRTLPGEEVGHSDGRE